MEWFYVKKIFQKITQLKEKYFIINGKKVKMRFNKKEKQILEEGKKFVNRYSFISNLTIYVVVSGFFFTPLYWNVVSTTIIPPDYFVAIPIYIISMIMSISGSSCPPLYLSLSAHAAAELLRRSETRCSRL